MTSIKMGKNSSEEERGREGQKEGEKVCPLLFLKELGIEIDTHIGKQKGSINGLWCSVVLHIIEIKVY